MVLLVDLLFRFIYSPCNDLNTADLHHLGIVPTVPPMSDDLSYRASFFQADSTITALEEQVYLDDVVIRVDVSTLEELISNLRSTANIIEYNSQMCGHGPTVAPGNHSPKGSRKE